MDELTVSNSVFPEWVSQQGGLTDEEVVARRAAGQVMVASEGPTISELVRKYVLTVFNLGLFSLIILQILFQKPWDALVSALLMIFGLSINVGQELWARRRLAGIAAERKETITVIRNGEVKAIDLEQMVIDDLVFASIEDLITADGIVFDTDQFIVDESLITDQTRPVIKKEGDKLYTGSICVGGSGTYRVEMMPQDSQAFQELQKIESQPDDYSPLQRMIDLVLRALIVIVTYFGLVLVLDYALVETNVLNHSAMAAMVFGLAPNGLFFMIILSYTMGAAMISRRGALIPNVTSIEALAQVSTLCLGRTGSLTHVNIDIQPNDAREGTFQADLERIVGDYALNTTSQHPIFEEMAVTLPGERRPVSAELAVSANNGWGALAFEDDRMYVLGLAEILEPQIDEFDHAKPQEEQSRTKKAASILGRFGRMFQRPRKASQKVISMLMFGDQMELILAYSGDKKIKFDEEAKPLIPSDLTSLGRIRVSEEIRLEAKEMIDFFTQAGVSIKLLSDDEPGEAIALAEQVGIVADESISGEVVTGDDLVDMDRTTFSQAAKTKSIFSRLATEQKGALVQALRDQGEYVGMMGSSIHDLLALKNANMWITPESGNQAIRRFADIVLLKNSLATLRFVFREGERIINGLTDVFRVYLTQILYFGILIVTIGILDLGFPLSGKQNSAVTLVTVHIPAMALSIFAVPGKTPRGKIPDMLFHFIIPAGILTSIAGFSMYFYFLVSTNDLAYAQLAMTHTLVFCGALTILFVEPPLPIFAGGDIYRGNKWPAIVVIVLVLIFLLLSPTGLGKELFDLQPMSSVWDYLIVLGTAAIFGLLLKTFWRFRVFDRYMRIDTEANPNV